jgi:apolipoprotein N-acyltransferase
MQLLINPFSSHSKIKKELLLALMTAVSFSLFLYLEYFGYTIKLLNTISGLIALLLLLHVNRRTLFLSGFIIGLLWFYWIGYSFKYYHVAWMVPIVTIGFGAVYSLFFALISLSSVPLVRALIIFLLTFFEPFDFNWMQPELLFVNSYFGIFKWQFALILLSLALFLTLKSRWRALSLVLLLGALSFNTVEKELPPLKIKLISMSLPQEQKWQPQMREKILNYNFSAIEDAIREKYDVVVLSESAFPLFLNHAPLLMQKLKRYSKDIAIVTGSLEEEGGHNYNVTYLFDKEQMSIARKMVLVPFGEYIPLPSLIREYVNRTFFDGASDYVSSDTPTDFTIKGVTFRNAVCYEATCEEIYKGNPKYLIAISNNAWFMPSIEPTLQKLLMQFYAKKHNSVIFHAANMAGTGVIR